MESPYKFCFAFLKADDAFRKAKDEYAHQVLVCQEVAKSNPDKVISELLIRLQKSTAVLQAQNNMEKLFRLS